VIIVSATDADYARDNVRLAYSIVPSVSDVHRMFNITTIQGAGHVTLAGKLDRERIARYELVIRARDHGTPSHLESTVILVVTVTDVNDNAPTFITSESPYARAFLFNFMFC